jgi:non-heme chloroperoxidase
MPYMTIGKENSGNIDLYYEDHGSGKPIILIHGWPVSSASWEKQVTVLLDAGYRVITYDRRGFGFSSKTWSGYDYDTLAEDLHKLILKLDLRDATIVGFSMGGGEVARYLGIYGPERVKKAVFISAIPPFLVNTPNNPAGVDKTLFDQIQAGLVADRPAFLTQFFANLYNADLLKGKLISEQAMQLAWNIAVEASPRATYECVTAWLTDFRGDLARITIPTLVIHGDTDRICPFPVTGKRIHDAVKSSTLVVIREGPHGLIWTHAGEVNEALVEFLGR